MRSPLSLLFLALALSLAISWWFSPVREATFGGNPTGQLTALVAKDGDLAAALAAADRADPGPLVQWLNRAEPLQRQHLGLLLLQSAAGDPADDRTLYRQRHRLLPFTTVSTGNARLDHELDNAVAYALVAGIRTPVPEEVAIATRLADRLEVPAKAERHHGWWDTIGCVRFAAGDATRAQAAFREAVTQAEAAKAATTVIDLYRRRLAASERLATQPQEALPLDWPTP